MSKLVFTVMRYLQYDYRFLLIYLQALPAYTTQSTQHCCRVQCLLFLPYSLVCSLCAALVVASNTDKMQKGDYEHGTQCETI